MVAAAYSVLSHLNTISIVLSVDKHVPNDEIKLTETIQYIIVLSFSLSNYSLAVQKIKTIDNAIDCNKSEDISAKQFTACITLEIQNVKPNTKTVKGNEPFLEQDFLL